MYKYILILLCLFSPNISSIYAPMSAKSFEFDVEDICAYQNINSDFMYVEPCEKDYSCDIIVSSGPAGTSVGICRKNLEVETPYGATCEKDDDCESGYNLKCDNKICVLAEESDAIQVSDIYSSSNYYYYCPNKNLFALYDDSNGTPIYKCSKIEDHTNMKDLCELVSENKKAYPDYMKVCGEIEFDDNNVQTKIKMDSIGSVSDGKFVINELACKSGLALNFYPDGKTTSTSPSAIYYPKCVQYNGIEYRNNGDSCKIKYILDKKDYYYDADTIDINLINGVKQTFCSKFKFIDTKLDLFNKYVNKVTELGNQCSNIKYYDEPYTCKNDELRKLYYFYNNIDEYLLYKNEDEITEFLIQQTYHSYGVKFSKTDSSHYLSNKFIFLLILLLL